MIQERKEKLRNTFVPIAIVYILILLFLMFFNGVLGDGLGFTQQEKTDEGLIVYAENRSSMIIKDINIYYLDKSGESAKGKEIGQLMPKEKVKILVQKEWIHGNKVTLTAKAPFYVDVEKTITVGEQRGVNLSQKIDGPSVMVLGIEGEILFEICNNGDDLEGIKIDVIYQNALLDSNAESYEANLKQNQCDKRAFTLIPKAEGTGVFYFNVTVPGIAIQSSQKEIQIRK